MAIDLDFKEFDPAGNMTIKACKCGCDKFYLCKNMSLLCVKCGEYFNPSDEPPNPQYELGQTVWHVDCAEIDGVACSSVIVGRSYESGLWGKMAWRYELANGYFLDEQYLYIDKNSLAKAVIEYWHKQLEFGETFDGKYWHWPTVKNNG